MSIDSDLISAYKNAEYVVFANPEFVFWVDQFSPPLHALMNAKQCNHAAFITAYNPHSLPMTESENRGALSLLRSDLRDLSFDFVEGEGRDKQGIWPPEKSLLVLNINKACAVELGNKYRQNALIWICEDAIPSLLLLNNDCDK